MARSLMTSVNQQQPDVRFAGSKHADLYDRVWRVLSRYRGYTLAQVCEMTGLGQRNARIALYALQGYGYATVERIAGEAYWKRTSAT